MSVVGYNWFWLCLLLDKTGSAYVCCWIQLVLVMSVVGYNWFWLCLLLDITGFGYVCG
jgi:hypothetical protein